MFYTDESRFTEEEKMIVRDVTRIVCHVMQTDFDGVVGRSRLAIHSDSRKIISHYLYNNVRRAHSSHNNDVSLASWFLNKDHGSVSTAVRVAESLYETDLKFREKYDQFIACLNGADYDPVIDTVMVIDREYTWEEVRNHARFPFDKRINLVPDDVKDIIIDMYVKGYSVQQISFKVKCSKGFIPYLVKHYNVKKTNRTINHHQFKVI